MGMRKKVGLAALSLLFAFGSIVQAGGAPEKKAKTVLTMATPFQTGHILADASEKFKELVEAGSKGKIRVELTVGGDTEENVNLRNSQGLIDIQMNSARPIEVFAPEYFFVNVPYVMKDYEHFLRVWNGKLGREAKQLVYENGGLITMGNVYRGQRQTTANKPILGPQELVDLKLRLPVVPSWVKVWSQLETSPVQVPLPNLYSSLVDGRAEASEGDLSQIDAFKLYEVQSHLMITNHLVAAGYATIHKDSMNRLSKKEQKLVLQAMQEATEWASTKMKANESALLEKLQSLGMTIVKPDADAIRAKAKPAVEELFRTEFPVTTWEEVLAQ